MVKIYKPMWTTATHGTLHVLWQPGFPHCIAPPQKHPFPQPNLWIVPGSHYNSTPLLFKVIRFFFFFKQRREQQVGQESEEMPRGLHANFCGKTHSEVVKSLEKRLFIRHPQPSVIRNPLHPPGLLHSLSAQPFMEASHSSTTQQQYPDRFHRIPWQTDCMLKAIISFLFWGVSFCYLVIIIYYFTNKLKAATSWTELPFRLYSLSNRFIIIKNGVAATRISECLYDSIDFVDGEEPGHYPRQRTVLYPQHHCGQILQICPLQHLQDPVFPPKGRNVTHGPSTGHLSLLDGLLASATKPLQHIQNAAACLVYSLPKCSHVTPTGLLLWLASNSRWWCWPSWPSIELNLSTSKHWSDHAPQHEHFTTSAGRPVAPSLKANKSSSANSQLFSILAPDRWNELPTNVRTAE